MAVSIVAAVLFVASLFRGDRQFGRWFFCGTIALLSGLGVLVTETVAMFWIDASRQQETVMAALRPLLAEVPDDSTILLDGVCQYDGPGTIFETSFDTTAAIQIASGNPTLRGDITRRGMTATASGIDVPEDDLIPYENLYLFRADRGDLIRVSGATEAATELASSPNLTSCPSGFNGEGVTISDPAVEARACGAFSRGLTGRKYG